MPPSSPRLGAGLGILGLVAGAAGAAPVTATRPVGRLMSGVR
ncbi:hypothetical protein [Actinoplanes sp. ATCC 53533]|nr:hypothetical protein [Actinoplanes sp. ATCC 53533]